MMAVVMKHQYYSHYTGSCTVVKPTNALSLHGLNLCKQIFIKNVIRVGGGIDWFSANTVVAVGLPFEYVLLTDSSYGKQPNLKGEFIFRR